MSGFTKLASTIVLSTVWREPHTVRIVWITMLALADAGGYVAASLPGLADAARVTLEECEQALACFRAPDPYSRSKAHDGRRIEDVEGGWHLLNYETYRSGRDPETRRRQNREAQARRRGGQPESAGVSHGQPEVSRRQPTSAQAEAEAEAEAEAGSREREPRAQRSSTKPKRVKWRRVPADWQPQQQHRELAAELRVDFDLELAKFRDHDFAAAKSDADAAFRNWLRGAKPSAKSPQYGGARAGDFVDGLKQRALDLEARERETPS